MQHCPPSVSRRGFLWQAGALAASAAASAAFPRVLFANTGAAARLVVVILRGALDGLAAVPPYGDRHYAILHRELAIPAPGGGGALALDRLFGLHPSLEFLHERYLGGELLAFHAVASPYRDRSHFDGQNVLENGLSYPIGVADGWLNRALASLPTRSAGATLPAVAISQNIPLLLRGDVPVLSKSPLATPEVDEDFIMRLADLYSKDDWFSARLSEAVQGTKLENPGVVEPAGGDRTSNMARMAAAVMSGDGGPQVAVMEATGWDTHANQGGSTGALANRLAGLDHALRLLAAGLGPLWQQTAVLIVTEFGRTAAINGTRGTDHGTGGCALLVGGAVRGGRVIADWPGLAPGALLDNRDLRPTLDLRSVFKAVLGDHLHVDARTLSAHVFPNSNGARPLQGLIRA